MKGPGGGKDTGYSNGGLICFHVMGGESRWTGFVLGTPLNLGRGGSKMGSPLTVTVQILMSVRKALFALAVLGGWLLEKVQIKGQEEEKLIHQRLRTSAIESLGH